MDDVTIRVLLSRFIKQALQDARAEANDDDQFAEAVGSAAWNSLIYLLRQSLVQQGRVTLQEVGEFVKESGSWTFHPAASLAEADAFTLPPAEGRKQLARLALFHLEQGRDLAQSIPKDVENPRARESKRYSSAIVADIAAEDPDPTLADELRKVAVEIFRLARNLSNQQNFDIQPLSGSTAGDVRSGIIRPGRLSVPNLDQGYLRAASDAPTVKPMDREFLKPDRVKEAAPEIIPLDDLLRLDE